MFCLCVPLAICFLSIPYNWTRIGNTNQAWYCTRIGQDLIPRPSDREPCLLSTIPQAFTLAFNLMLSCPVLCCIFEVFNSGPNQDELLKNVTQCGKCMQKCGVYFIWIFRPCLLTTSIMRELWCATMGTMNLVNHETRSYWIVIVIVLESILPNFFSSETKNFSVFHY